MDNRRDIASNRFETTLPESPFAGISGVILAGGDSRRMGSDKAFLPILGARFIDHVYLCMERLFSEVLIITRTPAHYGDIPCRKVTDIYPGLGALAGIHSGLLHATSERIFVAACDMPFISPIVVRYICSFAAQGDLVLPYTSGGHEPLQAVYSRACLPAIEQVLEKGQRRVGAFFDRVRVIKISADEIIRLDPEEKSFCNINTPEDYFRLRNGFQVDLSFQVAVGKISKK